MSERLKGGDPGIKFILLMSAAGGVALAAIAFWPHTSPTTPDQRAPAASVETENSSAPFYRPEAGKRYIYGFERKINFGGLGQGKIPEVVFHGELRVDVQSADEKGFTALVSETLVEAGGHPSPFVKIKANASGEKVSLLKSPLKSDDEEQHISVLKDLVANWLFPLRTDTVGAYEATMESLPAGTKGPAQRKTKIRYLAKSKTTPLILFSRHTLRWDDALRLPADVAGEEETRVGGQGLAFNAVSSYHLEFRSVQPIPHLSANEDWNIEDSLAIENKGNFRHHPDYEKLDWQEIMGRLHRLDAMSGKEQLNAFGDMMKALRIHPEKSTDLFSMLLDPSLLKLGASSPLFRSLVGALATLGTPEAQATLIQAYSDPSTPVNGKGMIESALTTSQATQTDPTLAFLASERQNQSNPDLANGAAYALGSGLQNAGNSPAAMQAIATIQSDWANAGNNATAEMNLLDTMGNSGREEFLPDIQPVIDDTNNSDALRAKAIFALRFTQSPDATQELLQYLGNPDPTLRAAAVNAIALATWNEAYRAPITTCASADPLNQIKSSCQKILQQESGTVADAGSYQ